MQPPARSRPAPGETRAPRPVAEGPADPRRPRSYRAALEAAYSLGRADGRLSADLGLLGTPSPLDPTCRGRDPEDFARFLWAPGPGAPPSGLEINAPLWYAHGFRDAVAEQRGPSASRTEIGDPSCSA